MFFCLVSVCTDAVCFTLLLAGTEAYLESGHVGLWRFTPFVGSRHQGFKGALINFSPASFPPRSISLNSSSRST